MNYLKSYWPSAKNVELCIKTEAEELQESLLLAVHEPMTLYKRDVETDKTVKSSEDEFYKFFLDINRPIPVVGSSGVGKSHLVRWVDAKLRRHDKNNEYHIVRIPKNSSLIKVLELIVKDIDTKSLNEIKRKIYQVVNNEVDEDKVAENLSTHIRINLNELFDNASKSINEIKTNNKKVTEEELNYLKKIIKHAGPNDKNLQGLLLDPTIRKHFLSQGKCLHNIATRVCKGMSDNDIAEKSFQLTEEDFQNIINLGEANNSVQQYIINKQLNTRQKARIDAVSVINEVIPRSCEDTFVQFSNIGKPTFQQLFEDIRKYLLTKNKTLVLLIEDFAALTAIHDILVDCMLAEEIRDGKKVLCSMKSIIAVTEGYSAYQNRRDTIFTRAKNIEWVIKDKFLNDDDTEKHIVNLCARYLNAARNGIEELEKCFKDYSKNDELYRLSVFKDEDITENQESRIILDSFDYATKHKISLFPFNKTAITQLAHEYCYVDGVLLFKPRRIIQKIIQDTLIYRDEYLDGKFPSNTFSDRKRMPFMVSLLQNEKEESRVFQTLSIWGGIKQSIDDVDHYNLKNITEEFGIKINCLNPNQTPVQTPVQTPNQTPVQTPNQTPVTSKEPKEIEGWKKILENWYKGNKLKQQSARTLRNMIIDGFKYYIDFSQYNYCPNKNSFYGLEPGYINLPHSQGNKSVENPALKVADDNVFDNEVKGTEIHDIFISIIRFNFYENWDYPEGLKDYCLYSNFFNINAPIVEKYILERFANKEIIGSHAKSLLLTSKILGVPCAFENTKMSILEAIFYDFENNGKNEKVEISEEWSNLQYEIKAKRNDIREELLNIVGIRKGISAYSVDSSIILEEISDDFANNPKVNYREKDGVSYFDNKLNNCKNILLDLKVKLVLNLGESFLNKEDFLNLVDQIRETIKITKKQDSFDSNGKITSNEFLKMVDQFEEIYIKDKKFFFEIYKDFNENNNSLLKMISLSNESTIRFTNDFIDRFSLIYTYTDRQLSLAIQSTGGEIIEQLTDQINFEILTMEKVLENSLGE